MRAVSLAQHHGFQGASLLQRVWALCSFLWLGSIPLWVGPVTGRWTHRKVWSRGLLGDLVRVTGEHWGAGSEGPAKAPLAKENEAGGGEGGGGKVRTVSWEVTPGGGEISTADGQRFKPAAERDWHVQRPWGKKGHGLGASGCVMEHRAGPRGTGRQARLAALAREETKDVGSLSSWVCPPSVTLGSSRRL